MSHFDALRMGFAPLSRSKSNGTSTMTMEAPLRLPMLTSRRGETFVQKPVSSDILYVSRSLTTPSLQADPVALTLSMMGLKLRDTDDTMKRCEENVNVNIVVVRFLPHLWRAWLT